MIRVGSYVWYHDRRDPTDIMKQFGACDVILLQRFPNGLRSYFGDCWYIENWQSHGMLVRGCKKITTVELTAMMYQTIKVKASTFQYCTWIPVKLSVV